MNVSYKNTQEMILGPLSKHPTTALLIAAKPVRGVTEYKPLGVTVNATLKWDDHVLKKLKQAGVDRQDRLYFFKLLYGKFWSI